MIKYQTLAIKTTYFINLQDHQDLSQRHPNSFVPRIISKQVEFNAAAEIHDQTNCNKTKLYLPSNLCFIIRV